MSLSYHTRGLRKVYSFSTAEIQHIYTGCHLSKDFMMLEGGIPKHQISHVNQKLHD